MGSFFDNMSTMQKSLSDLSLAAHEQGFRRMSGELADFSHRIEQLNGDLQVYFHDNERVLRSLKAR
jgi:hypothetical protein